MFWAVARGCRHLRIGGWIRARSQSWRCSMNAADRQHLGRRHDAMAAAPMDAHLEHQPAGRPRRSSRMRRTDSASLPASISSSSSPCSPAHRRGEMPRRDLRRRPPQDVIGGLGGAVRAAHAARRAAREQLAAQHGDERLRLDVGARARRDVLGGGVRHLGRQPTELDGEVDAVAGRVHAGDALHGAVTRRPR